MRRWWLFAAMTLGGALLGALLAEVVWGAPLPQEGPAVPHPIEGREACLDCHTLEGEGDLVMPADHTGRVESMCLACHPAATEPTPAEEPTATAEPTAPPAATAIPATPIPLDAFKGPENCGGCHPDRYERWSAGPHAHALEDPLFQEAWVESGSAPYCLACHTTGYNPRTGEYALDAVTCESCHGPYDAGHPPAVVHIDRSGEICRGCHPVAYDEWHASRHGQVGTRCVSCHEICSLETRTVEGRAVCETCHSSVADDFHQTTHAEEGLDCTQCHMHAGTGEMGHEFESYIAHNFLANATSCTDCHAETAHISNAIIDLEAQVSSLEEEGVDELQQEKAHLEAEADALRADMSGRLYAGLAAGGVVGLSVGFAAAWMWRRGQHDE